MAREKKAARDKPRKPPPERPEKAPRRRTLRGKLVLLVLTSVGVAVALIAGASAWRDGQRAATLETARLRATATVIGSLSAEAAAAGDRNRAFRALASIRDLPGVTYARIERADGTLLVETGQGARLLRDVRVSTDGGTASLWSHLTSGTSEVSAPISFEGRDVGRLVLLSRTEGMWDRFIGSLQVSLIAAIAAAIVGLLVAWRLQRAITRPIVALTGSMKEVQADHGYDRTVDIKTDDEVGELVTGFNRMLAEIRARDAAIAAHVAGLEHTVAERTRDLSDAKDAADAANSAKSDFLATMSHEIRTPMNGIMVMAEMLAAGDMPPRQRRFAEVIAKSGSSLLAIINDILDFSKIEAGKMDLEVLPTDVGELAEDVSSLFWEKATSKGLDLAVYIDPATPKVIEGDPTRLRQVIGNLVNNAIKFTETGGVLIEIEPDSATSIRVSVRDTGIGIPANKIGDLFGAFSQADQSTTRKYGGTGLGLAICKKLVESMGGRFNVTSQVGKGSTFAFRIPVAVVEPAAGWPAAMEGAERVVIAHDGVATRRALGRYLARAGYAMAKAEDQARADLIVGGPGGLAELTFTAPAICIGDYGDGAPHDLLKRGVVQALLIQPFRRSELEPLLRQMQFGAPLEAVQAEASAAAKAGETLPHFPTAHILVADDSAVNREVAMEALSRLSVRVTMVADGKQAVDKALAERFDLILMDGSMPEMDGYEATREIRRLETERGYARTPIVALTAHVVGSAAEAWREADMDAVLHKPFTLAAMAKTLAQFIEPGEAPAAVEPSPQAVVETAAGSVTADPRLIDADVAASLASMAAGGKTDFVAKVTGLYRDNAPKTVADICAAAEAGAAEAAAKAAHALKSMSLNIGAKEVSRRAAEIEHAARDGVAPSVQVAAELRQVLTETLACLGGAPAPAAPPPAPPALVAAAPTGPTITVTQATAPPDVKSLLDDLHEAIRTDQLSLVYQPQYDREGRQILGVECLVRWTHPTRGCISPADFIPLAEAWGRIQYLTDWVMDRALKEMADIPGLQVAFNASALEFTDAGIVERIQALLTRTGFDPKRLEVEITETAILSNEDQVRENMNLLREMGLKVALDDFGAGYSSLGHLRRYPFDKLKIDREFVTDCTGDVQSATVVHAVVSIGRALGMRVVAEGVETEQQRQFLKIAGVHAMQGYLFGKPMPLEQLKALMTPEARRQAMGG